MPTHREGIDYAGNIVLHKQMEHQAGDIDFLPGLIPYYNTVNHN